ncbi:ABC transporter ATP-binding protein [Nocardioides panzhihuensis]|uniref:ABC-2 type transport system ATP-binding protein n=1 Tax=Nocardioides panzhihuensis TaxID=860243 RepID=A0A7Z0IQW4_9ACTN|nr:ABC transporter ATP-binding protein [Nocardioides panzhihuensis]NYI76203.1 ABC-2 type transport system ATP-binding protein [Nocardioides panzhihuensis]
MTALSLDSISHTFPASRTPWSRRRVGLARPALDGLTLHVDHGEVVAMIGLNGAGKTTALRALAGRLSPDSGTVKILGHDAAELPRDVAAQFGHVVDAPLVFADLTVTENLRAAARLHGCSSGQTEELATAARSRLGLDAWADVRARALSQGNRQRLGIGGATIHSPRALVLDEPTSALDPRGVVIVRELVRDLAAQGAAVLVSSHHLDEVSRIADRIVAVHAGHVVDTFAPEGPDLESRFFASVLAAEREEPRAAMRREA